MGKSRNLLNGIDLVTLRLLVAAYEEGNMARVAERENIAISAVSRRIGDFEERYGVAIFDRHDRGIAPTPDGRLLLDRIMAALGELEQVASDLVDRRVGVAGIVRIQAHSSSVVSGLPHRIAAFLRAHRGIDFTLEECTSRDIVHAIQSGQCDIGLVSGTVDARGLEFTALGNDELVAILPVASPLAARDILSLEEVLGEPFIGMQPDSALLRLYRTQAHALNLTLRERVHCTSFESVRRCVEAGLGVSILPAQAIAPCHEQARVLIRRLSDSWVRRPLILCHRARARVSLAARLMIDHLVASSSEAA